MFILKRVALQSIMWLSDAPRIQTPTGQQLPDSWLADCRTAVCQSSWQPRQQGTSRSPPTCVRLGREDRQPARPARTGPEPGPGREAIEPGCRAARVAGRHSAIDLSHVPTVVADTLDRPAHHQDGSVDMIGPENVDDHPADPCGPAVATILKIPGIPSSWNFYLLSIGAMLALAGPRLHRVDLR